MHLIRKIYLLGFIINCISLQANISLQDSLIQLLENKSLQDTTRINLLNELTNHYREFDYEKAIYHNSKSLELALKTNYKKGIIDAYFLGGYTYYNFRKYSEATEYFQKTIEYCTDTDNYKRAGDAYRFLATTLVISNEKEQSISYFIKAVDKYKLAKNIPGIITLYNDLGNLYGSNDSDKSLSTYLKAIKLSDKLDPKHRNMTQKAYILNNIGSIYLGRGDKENALKYYYQARDIAENNQAYNCLALVYSNLGSYHLWQNDTLQAITHLQKALDIAVKNDYPGRISPSASMLIEIYSKQEKHKESSELKTILAEAKDKINKDLLENRIALIIYKNKTEKEQKLRELRWQKRKIMYVAIILSLLSTTLIVILLLSRQKNKTKHAKLNQELLNEKLNSKDRELTSKAISIGQYQEFMNNVSEKLRITKYNLKKQNQPSIDELISEIRTKNKLQVWEDFDISFNRVHKDFYKNLNADFPNITPNDKRLCAFLKLNMSSKEISSITFIDIRSVDKARTRLRKKFNMSKTENFTGFLSKY